MGGTLREKGQKVAAVFQEAVADEAGIARFLPSEDWTRYVRASVEASSGGVAEWKTGAIRAVRALV